MGDWSPLQLAVSSFGDNLHMHLLALYRSIYCVRSLFFFLSSPMCYCITHAIPLMVHVSAIWLQLSTNLAQHCTCNIVWSCFVTLHCLEKWKKNPKSENIQLLYNYNNGDLRLCIGFFACRKCIYDVGQVGQFWLDFTGKLVILAKPVEQELCVCWVSNISLAFFAN